MSAKCPESAVFSPGRFGELRFPSRFRPFAVFARKLALQRLHTRGDARLDHVELFRGEHLAFADTAQRVLVIKYMAWNYRRSDVEERWKMVPAVGWR